jgi:hypothetical protein
MLVGKLDCFIIHLLSSPNPRSTGHPPKQKSGKNVN